MGNVHGRFEGMNSTAETLLIGSHLVMTQARFFFILQESIIFAIQLKVI